MAEVLIFEKNDVLAHVVTDGGHTAIYDSYGRKLYRDIYAAIAHLEAEGYHILIQ